MIRRNSFRSFKPSGRSLGSRKSNRRQPEQFAKSRFRAAGGRRIGGGGRSRASRQMLDVNSFINKAVTTTEKTDYFVPDHSSFDEFAISNALKEAISSRHYDQPTPIQDKIIPHALHGEDVVGLANTGTGKTAAFLIPLINKVIKNPKEQVLIMVPTRELAIQIEEELKKLVVGMRIFSVVCVGGAGIKDQIYKLKKINQFVIGTPGRLIDLIRRGALRLDSVKNVVLDEADLMLDMGFIEDMRFLLGLVSKERQTMFFAATMSKAAEIMVKNFLKNPVVISVKTRDTSQNVDQDIIRIKGENKIDLLLDLLIKPEFEKVLIFGKTKYGVEDLYRALLDRGIKAESIHGNKTHAQRQRALKKFKESDVQVLVATDVASRGLDIKGVSHVINYDLPATYDDYVHRIGRTGRADKMGKAITFVK